MTKEEYIFKCKEKHGDKFCYSSLPDVVNMRDSISFICKYHGEVQQNAYQHLIAKGCSRCYHEFKNRKSKDQFITEAKLVHGDKYDYSLVECKGSKKVEIICDKHGHFFQNPHNHLRGRGCRKCQCEKATSSTKQFIEKAKEVHGDRFDYSQTVYSKAHEKLIIKCIKHGNFSQKANDHINGAGCPRCKESRGEGKIRKFLEDNGIVYEQEKRFDGCRKVKPLPFDFYIPSKNLLIEYHGSQHFKIVNNSYFGDESSLKKRKEIDEFKKQWALDSKINYLEVKYTDNIKSKLNFLKEGY